MDSNSSDVSLNKFYNLNIWWPSEGYTLHNYSPIHALLWLVWRVYTGACFLNNVTITVLTSEKFFGNGPPMSSANVPEQRLRNILFRLKKKINNAVQILIKLPIDTRSNEILGITPFTMSPEATAKAIEGKKLIHGVPAKYWIKRLESLVVKPAVMCQTVLFSRHEIGSMFSYIATAMEAKAASNKAIIDGGGAPPTPPPEGVPSTSSSESPLYQAILDYLKVNNHFNKAKNNHNHTNNGGNDRACEWRRPIESGGEEGQDIQ